VELINNLSKVQINIADVCYGTDIDECAVNNGGCSDNAYCTNSPGSHNCTCIGGYIGNGFSCTRTLPHDVLIS